MSSPPVLLAVLAGLVGGVALFARGLIAYRHDRLVSSVATSSVQGIAAGEVRVSGVVEAVEHTLISPLQSKPCVWYRAKVEENDDDRRVLLSEEWATQFRVKDATGEIRVMPQGARWEIAADFDASTDLGGAEPPGLLTRTGQRYAAAVPDDPAQMTEAEREAAIEALLTVSLEQESGEAPGTSAGRRYREARLEPGDTVTIVGQALPWADVRTQLGAPAGGNEERDSAEDITAARASGALAASAEEAWGNAAIPGFGIGRPIRRPELDPDALMPAVAGVDDHDRALERYEIPDEELVLARGPRHELAIYAGAPSLAVQHHDPAFFLGLAGAMLATLCAFALGMVLSEGL